MQQQLISLNPDLNRLQEEGYDIEVKGGHLVVRQIPYATPSKNVAYGTLVCVLNYVTPTKISTPPDHTIFFCGETPCNADEGFPFLVQFKSRQFSFCDLLYN